MADYYDVEPNGRGGFTVTPQENSGCLPALIFALIVAIVCLFNQCSGGHTTGATSSDEAPINNSIINQVDANGELSLFSIPYSRSMDKGVELVSGGKYDHTDLDGRTHPKPYVLNCEGFHEQGLVYNIEGAFSQLTGELYAQNEGTECWLEFYNGDSLLFVTEKLSDNNTSCHVNVNVSNVELLTIYLCSEIEGRGHMQQQGWLIAENFKLK